MLGGHSRAQASSPNLLCSHLHLTSCSPIKHCLPALPVAAGTQATRAAYSSGLHWWELWRTPETRRELASWAGSCTRAQRAQAEFMSVGLLFSNTAQSWRSGPLGEPWPGCHTTCTTGLSSSCQTAGGWQTMACAPERSQIQVLSLLRSAGAEDVNWQHLGPGLTPAPRARPQSWDCLHLARR